jgi:dTDP-4-dehydrorhamnose 3,5-epimerase and related enzymes
MPEFIPLPIAGAFSIRMDRHEDERGFFGRVWDAAEFEGHGLSGTLAQVSLSLNPRRGTLRGLHYQAAPHEEVKLITCVRGSVWDVIVDLRPESPTFCAWYGETLDATSLGSLYVPEGCAHGYLTTSDDALLLYEVSEMHDPALARGIRWDDPAFGIRWPSTPLLVNARDREYPDFPYAATPASRESEGRD